MKCLVTGASGFIGSYLVEFLIQEGHRVCALGQKFGRRFPSLVGELQICEGNIQESGYVEDIILDYKPEFIFHLAAQSSPGVSVNNSVLTFQVNTIGTVNLLEAVVKAKLEPRIILASSSAVYASSTDLELIKENYHTDPSSSYGLSKLFLEQIAKLYIKKNELDVMIARPFFLIGPRKVNDVCSTFARNIVAIERGHGSHIAVGNLEIVRDFMDIHDGIKAFYMIAHKGLTGEAYNICSGEGHSLRYVLDFFKEHSSHTVSENIDLSKIRTIDELARIGDPGKVMKLGWNPLFEIDVTLANMLQYWRADKSTYGVDDL